MPHVETFVFGPAPSLRPSCAERAQELVDRLHQAVGEVLTAQRHSDPDAHIEAAAVGLLVYLLRSSGPTLAYRAAAQKIAREDAEADRFSAEELEVIYGQYLGGLAAGAIGEMLDAVRVAPGADPMRVLSDALAVYDDAVQYGTD